MVSLFIQSSYFRKITIGIIVLGFTAGSTGVFVTERKQALIGDSLSHASLPGVVIAFMLFNTKNIWILLSGALVAAIISMFLIEIIAKYTKVKFDASMALILSSFFGLGNVLLNFLTGADQSGLNKFIFGEAATMLQKDVNMILIVSLVILTVSIIFFKHIKLYIFDQNYYHSLGFNKNVINILLTVITVLIVVISIRAIGVILMSALLIAPSVTARLWSNKFGINYIISGILGGLSGLIGTFLSFKIKNLPTGPIIVIVLSVFLILSLLFSYKKGVISKLVKQKRHKYLINKYHDLLHLYNYNYINSNNINYFKSKDLIITKNDKYVLSNKGESLVINILRGEKLWD